MPSRTLVVVNPRSRGGATGRRWVGVEAKLRDALGPLEVEFTRCPRDAERIAREGVRAGVERLLIAGGDGTTNEVVSGLLDAELARYAVLGLLPLGTGGDLARALGVPRNLDAAIALIARGKSRRLDAGHVRCRGRDGRERGAHFLNVASLGLPGLVTEFVNRAPKMLGARASYLFATLRGTARWRDVPVQLYLDGALVHEGPIVLATAANGPYFGGGMRVAPEARPDDGLLDVVVVRGIPRARLLRHLAKVYRGTHVGMDDVSMHRGRRLEARSDARVWIEIDGEPLGMLPATFEVIPDAVELVGGDG